MIDLVLAGTPIWITHMSGLPPFINSTGLIEKIFSRIAEAQQPARFTQDFLGTKLGYPSGSARPIIPLMKRLGFLRTDGTPTEMYSRFRNPGERGGAMASALRQGYSDVFERNEYAYELPRDKFRDLIVEMTGLEKSNSAVKAIVGTFFALKNFADFDPSAGTKADTKAIASLQNSRDYEAEREQGESGTELDVGMNLSYTINLNLPETDKIEVFDAIFKSLKEHLLRKSR
jgi:hypothetical protein